MVTLKVERASNVPGGFIRTDCGGAATPMGSHVAGPGWDLRTCVSKEFPDDVRAASLEATRQG